MMKSLLLAAISLLFVNEALGVAEYYSLSRSVRSLGMGGAFYGLSDDSYALFYNPAGLALYRGEDRINILSASADMSPKSFGALSAVQSASGNDIQTISNSLVKYQGAPLYGSANAGLGSWITKDLGFSFFSGDTKFNFAMLGKDLDTQADITGIADTGLAAGYATDLDDSFSVGMSLKILARAGGRKVYTLEELAEAKGIDVNQVGGAGLGIDTDLGAIYSVPLPKSGTFRQFHIGLSLNNLAASKFDLARFTPGSPPQLPRMASIGFHAATQELGPIQSLHLLLDFAEFSLGGQNDPDLGARTGSFFKHVNFGIEAPLVENWFIPRIGVHQGYLTAGFGLDLDELKIDFATYAEELALGMGRMSSRRLALRLELGWGGEKTAAAVTPISTTETKPESPAERKPASQPTPSEPSTRSVSPPARKRPKAKSKTWQP